MIIRYDEDHKVEFSSIQRDFDISIDDFEIEASLDKVNKYVGNDTKNIINSIMPFDTENCIKFNTNYLIGYNSENKAKISNIERKEEHLKTFTTSNEIIKVINIDKIEGDYIVKDDEI